MTDEHPQLTDEHPQPDKSRRGFLANLSRELIACAATAGVGWLATRRGVDCEAGSFCPGCPKLPTCGRPEAQSARGVDTGRRP